MPGDLTSRVRSAWGQWRDGTDWWSEPQPALRTLVGGGPDTRLRLARVAWLVTVARTARVAPWLAHRLLHVDRPPRTGPQPPVAEVLEQAGQAGAPRWARALWLGCRTGSYLADSPERTALAGLGLWGVAWSANRLPVLHWLVWDPITPEWWWQAAVAAYGHLTEWAVVNADGLRAAGLVVLGLFVLAAWGRNELNNRRSRKDTSE